MIQKLLFIGFFSSLFIISCKKGDKIQRTNKNDVEKANYVTFSGEIVHPNSDSLVVYNRTYKKKIAVKNGKFNDTLYIKEKGNYRFFDGAEYAELYLKNGYNLRLKIDAKQFDETLTYEGEGSEVNNYIAQALLIKEKNSVSEHENEYKIMTPTEISEKIDHTQSEFSTLLDKYKNLDSSFVVNQKKFIDQYAKNMMSQVLYIKNKEIFKDFSSYKGLSDVEVFEKIEGIRTKFLNAPNEYKNLDSTSIADQRTTLNAFVDQYKNKIESALAILKANKEASPLFANYENIDGSKTSLKDLRGKYVYIDVWATWCGPCKHELPYLKELQQKYRGRNITFVSISVDALKDREKWIKMVKEEKLGGIQLLAKNSWKSNFITEYKINGIPRFILIDPQGKIVSPDTYRPSEKENIEALFTSLNI